MRRVKSSLISASVNNPVSILPYLDGQNPNTFTTKYSGGALYDLGVYGVHFAVGLLGKPTNIHFSAHKLSTGTDGFSSLILEYPRGLVTINISKMTHGDSSFTIQGLKKKISSNFSVSTIDTFDVIENKQTTNFNEQPEDNMVYFLRNMVNIIKNNDHVAYEKQLNDSYLVSEIMEKGSSTRSVSYLIMISTKRDRTLVCVLPLLFITSP